MRVIAFDIWGDFAHFRKFYTTTSPLSFPFPPPPTIAGILGSIYGTSKLNGYSLVNRYLEVFGYDKCKVAIRILEPIDKVRFGINLIDTKARPNAFRTQIKTEFIRKPKYRIYVWHEDSKVIDALEQQLRNHAPTYSVSLGLAYLLADFKYVGTFNGSEQQSNDYVEVHSVIPLSKMEKIDFSRDNKVFKEKIPVWMTPDRIVKKHDFAIFDPDARSLFAKSKNIIRLDNGECIIFF